MYCSRICVSVCILHVRRAGMPAVDYEFGVILITDIKHGYIDLSVILDYIRVDRNHVMSRMNFISE